MSAIKALIHDINAAEAVPGGPPLAVWFVTPKAYDAIERECASLLLWTGEPWSLPCDSLCVRGVRIMRIGRPTP